MVNKLVILTGLVLGLSACASTGGFSEAIATAEAAARDAAAAKSTAEAARAAVDGAAQSAASAQSTADRALAAATEAQPPGDAAWRAADAAAQAAASAQSTADQALSAVSEAQAAADANRDHMKRIDQALSDLSTPESTFETSIPKSDCAPQRDAFICIWYGTNRKAITISADLVGYSGDRHTTMNYGKAIVHVPHSHKFGETGSNWVIRKIKGIDDRVKVNKLVALTRTEFTNAIDAELKSRNPGERSAFVYIHGYRTQFEEALIRAAQIGTDLKIEGITAIFSWPSAGKMFAYTADEAAISASEGYLESFLRLILSSAEVDSVNVLAHSMGNRALLRVVERLAKDPKFRKKPINQIILAAPDVDVGTFEQLAKHYPRVANRTTMYISAEDKLLSLSGFIHNFQRAGNGPPVTVVPGIDTIAVEEVDLSLLGHSYLVEAEAVLHDMYDLIRENLDPDKRIRLRVARNSKNQEYWFFR